LSGYQAAPELNKARVVGKRRQRAQRLLCGLLDVAADARVRKLLRAASQRKPLGHAALPRLLAPPARSP
jgi:hypothetical protein